MVQPAKHRENQDDATSWTYMRPMRIGLAGRIGIQWFCKRYNCDLKAIANGECRFYNTRGLLRLRPRVETVRIGGWGRFGNAVVQLVNAFRVAQRFRATTVQFAKEHPLLAGNQSGPFAIEVSRLPLEALTLEGKFLFLRAFPFRRAAPQEIARVITDLVRPILAPSITSPDPRVRDDDVVVHFRGGDVFALAQAPRSGHLYGQPPLSFYLAALEQERPARVWLVSEDGNNPCMEAAATALMERALRERRIDVIVRRFGNLTEDIRFMMSARTLIASRGSFTYMIAHLSTRLQRAYFFEPMRFFGEPANLPILRKLGVELIGVQDEDGEYKSRLFKGNWANTADQRELMLAYPIERLRFVRRPAM